MPLKNSAPKNMKRSWFSRYIGVAVWVVVLIFLVTRPFFYGSQSPKEISWPEFEQNLLNKNAVERIDVVNNEFAEVYIKKDLKNNPAFKQVLKPGYGTEPNPGPHYVVSFGSEERFEQKLEEAEKSLYKKEVIPVTFSKRSSFLKDIAGWLLPIILITLIWQFAMRRMAGGQGGGGSVFSFGKSNATLFEKEKKSSVTFGDVAGLDEAKIEVHEIVDFLKNPKTFTRLGAKIPKGVILVGPPGTGKTLLAKAVAGEAGVPFFSISGSEFVEMFVGVGASRVRDLFKQAKEKAPCIIFIDEIDAIGRSRSRNAYFTGANDERESTLNQLLTEMDGFGTNTGVIVLAATNRADMLDAALLRPGRFDRHIYLELPNLKEREAIFGVHLKPIVLAGSVSAALLAAQTPGFSGADIANICNEAALIAARQKKEKVGMQDFVSAVDRIIAGPEKKSKIISAEEKRTIAYHEAGHALVSWFLTTTDPLIKVSIIPRGKSLGAAWYLPDEKQLRTQTAFTEHLSATLAGRAAEEVVLHEISSGALDDLEKASKEAYTMVAYFGFDKKIGHVSFYDSSGQAESAFQKPYSEQTGKMIDEQVRKLIAEAYESAKSILSKNADSLRRIAELLLKNEIIYQDDLKKILGDRPAKNNPVSPALAEK